MDFPNFDFDLKFFAKQEYLQPPIIVSLNQNALIRKNLPTGLNLGDAVSLCFWP